jgi:predicted O-linked N-acetylglucosamine transferase (SPINDLY family)
MAKHAKPAKYAKHSSARPSLAHAKALYEQKRLDEAEPALAQLLKVTPGDHDAWTLYGHVLLARGQPLRAETAYRQAVQVNQRAFNARVNLGVLFSGRGDYSKAGAELEAALAVEPDHPLALRNYGGVLRCLGQLHKAEQTLRRAIEVDPRDGGARTNLGLVLADLGRNDDALEHLRAAVDITPQGDNGHHALLFTMNYASRVTPEDVAAAHRRFGAMVEARSQVLPRPPVASGRPLRVGFVSGDLRRHSVAFFLEPLLQHLPEQGFELHAYATCDLQDEITVHLREHLTGFTVVHGMGDRAIAERVQADGIDILVDLSGHTAHNRLGVFAYRPAPVQLTYLGYPNTTGLTRIDYRITDEECDPTGTTEQLHTEQLMRLAGGFLCFRPPQPCPRPAPPPSTTGEPLTFGSFNAVTKLSDDVLALWVRVLHAAPDARLYIKHTHLSSSAARAALEARLRALGAPLHRIELAGKIPDSASHLAAYGRVDVALDAYPYHGTTTTFEALWMGVPVVSLVGRNHVSRVGVSLLRRAGIADLLVNDGDAYVERALAIARDVARRTELRTSLRERMEASGMLDGARIARELGEAMRAAYARYAADAPRVELPAQPDNDQVAPAETSRSASYRLPGSVRLVGPKTDELTGYVLEEQGDWHEPEIAYVRKLVALGERALDLGSDHGAYAVSMAAQVGPKGNVLAVTSDVTCAERLRESARVNGFTQLGVASEVERLAIGPRDFVRISPAQLAGSELAPGLDACLAADPLVMVNLTSDPAASAALVEQLMARGLATYRLLPGLGFLYPQSPSDDLDPLLCNLFACSPARARALEERGLLAGVVSHAVEPPALTLHDFFRAMSALQGLDAGATFRDAVGGRHLHGEAIRHFAWARMAAEPPSTRAFALKKALGYALAASDEPTELSRYATLTRIAAAWGARQLSVEAADTAIAIQQAGKGRLREPGLPACERYDAYVPGKRFGDLLLSSLLEQREKGAAYSSFFTRAEPGSLARLTQLERLGFQSPEMARRLSQVRRFQQAMQKTG